VEGNVSVIYKSINQLTNQNVSVTHIYKSTSQLTNHKAKCWGCVKCKSLSLGLLSHSYTLRSTAGLRRKVPGHLANYWYRMVRKGC